MIAILQGSYYQDFMNRYGFQPARAQNLAFRINLEDTAQTQRLLRLANRVRSQGKVTIREANFDNWQDEIDK